MTDLVQQPTYPRRHPYTLRERLAVRLMGLATFALPAGHPVVILLWNAADYVRDTRLIPTFEDGYDD